MHCYQVTKVDFVAFEIIDKLLILDKELFSPYTGLVGFHSRFKVIRIVD